MWAGWARAYGIQTAAVTQGSLKDFEMFYPLMNDPFIISIHDTRNAYGYADGGVVATITAIRERWGTELDVLEWNHLGTGLAIVVKKNAGYWQPN
jgi:hypothetical protein